MKKFILFYRENTHWFSNLWLQLKRVFEGLCFNSSFCGIKFYKNATFCLAFLFFVFAQISSYGQSNTNNSQWGKNGPASAPVSPVNWANGNAQGTNSHFTEGQSIPTRIELDGLTPNVPASVTFDINIIQGSDGQHAFDFFTGPNRIDEIVSPLDGLTGYNPTKSTFVFPIPNAGNTGGVPASYYNETALKMACQQNADAAFPDKNSIWIYNGTVSNITYVWGNENSSSTQKTFCTVTFTPTSTKALLVLGCHIAAELTVSCEGWGVGNGASTISGSPYHFHIQNICSPLSNCVTLGSQDQQMASSSVIIPPTCSITPSSAEICAGATATFTASGINGSGGAPYTFAWTGPNGFTATTASITVGVAGTYSVIVSDKNGVPTEAPCTVNLVVNNNPLPSVDDEQACIGSTATFSTASVPGYSYQWYLNNVMISGATSNSYTTPVLSLADNGGVYKVIVIDGNHDSNCDGEDSGILTVNALPTVSANDAPVCAGFTVQLSASPVGGTWSGDHVSASGLFDAAGLAPGAYNVTYTYSDGNQCTNSDGAVVTVNALPTVSANDAPVCAGFTVQLSASPAGGTWSGDHVSASGLFDAAGLAPGAYNVTYTYTDGNQCTNSDGAVVTINALPVLDCPDDSMDNLVRCGLSVSDAQAATDSSFNAWFGSFATLNSDPDFEVINITYVYTPLSAQPQSGNAPLNPTLGVPGVVETSVLVTWTVQDENGCISSCSATFGLSYNCNLTCEASPTPILCKGADTGTIRVISGGATPPYTLSISGGNLQQPIIKVFQGDFDDVTIGLFAGSYTYLVTDATGTTCNTGSPIVISEPDAILSSTISNIDVLCNGNATGSIDLSPSGGTPPYVFAWSASNGGVIPAGQEDDEDLSGLVAGTYSVVITDANGNTGGCRAENSAIISQPDELSCSIEKINDELCAGGLNGSATVYVSGGSGGNSFLWDNGETSATATGLSGGLHTVIVTDSNGCETSCEITIATIPCDGAHCTYTQGFYGNYGGLGCTPDFGTVNSHVMMTNALTQVGGSYNFGSINTGNYFLLKLSDVTGAANPRDNKIYKMLPGGGTPRSLVGFATYDDYSTWSDNNPLTASGSKKGAINNNLLSQTMVLFFNMQIDHSLASFELESTFATAAAIECGSDIPNMDSVQIFNIPQRVIDYLNLNGGANVNNLFILANKALGGESISGLSHSSINAAVDAINRGFDKCRIQVGVPVDISVQAVNYEIGASDLSVKAYPNPFKDYIGLSYQFNYDSDVEIQIFDTKGTLLYNFKDTEAYFGKEVRIDASFNRGKGELFIIKLITDKETIIKKVISSNY